MTGPGQRDEEELSDDLTLSIRGVNTNVDEDGEYHITLHTTRGDIYCRFTPCEGEPGVAMFLSGAMGGLDGPAGGVYRRLAGKLVQQGVSSLRVQYREPGEFQECVLDVLGALSFIKGIGGRKVALVGHSFGGSVVIKAGELSPSVSAVAALAAQRYGTANVEKLAPKPLLLIHGTADQILPQESSEDIYERARQPKRLSLFEGAGHSFTECQDDLEEMLETFLISMAGPQKSEP